MHIIGALIGAIFTGLMWWVIFGNGKDAINLWLDSRNEKDRTAKTASDAMRAREQEKRAPLRSLVDPREAATAVLVALAEARGAMTDEQRHEIRAQMRTVLGYDDALDHHLAVAHHASRAAGSPTTVIDETAPLFEANLNESERAELLSMVEAVVALHGGPTDAQADLIDKLRKRIGLAPGV
jgi:uncharacterized tellurite resistance protein B-like protein